MDKACLKVMKEAELVIPIGKSFHKNEAFMKKEYLKELILEFLHNSRGCGGYLVGYAVIILDNNGVESCKLGSWCITVCS